MQTPGHITLETGSDPRYSVIWLHGLGASGADFEPIVPYLGLDPSVPVRFIFPHAPQIPVTCNGGYVMPAWYDIVSLSADSREIDERGLLASRDRIRTLINHEIMQGIPAERIFLAGFSQGGAVAYLTGLTQQAARLAGVIALSTYMPSTQQVHSGATEWGRATPVWMAHGTHDDVVSIAMGEAARDVVAALGCPYAWQTYPMGHEVCLPEIQAIGAWIKQRIADENLTQDAL
jgi:phospholipase/carboxylesterase